MFGSTVLDVAIGLVFIYCLYSLFASIINEIIASIFSLRAKMLESAIDRMLTDSKSDGASEARYLFNSFFGHPLIKYMSKNDNTKPSYIDPQNFSKTIVDVITNAAQGVKSFVPVNAIAAGLDALEEKIGIPISQSEQLQAKGSSPQHASDTIALLRSFLSDANNDLPKFRTSLEKWFNDTMDRASGWYKRKSQVIVFLIGLGLAAAFNASTFGIVTQLSKDKIAREQLAQIASSYVQHQGQTGVSSTNQKLDSLVLYADSLYKSDVSKANQILALGWSTSAKDNKMDDCNWPINVLGWIVTAIAISLGAPFWFDILSKLVQLRGTGPTPDEKAQIKKPNVN